MTENIAPVMELDELQEIFGYKNRRALQHALRTGKFPVATFEMADRTVAHVEVVAKYFEQKKQEGLASLQAGASPQSTDT